MKLIAVTTLLSALCGTVNAQSIPANWVVTHSVSGQFVILETNRDAPLTTAPVLATGTNALSLDAPLAAVSCERIKQALWRKLGISGGWRGRIYIRLRPAISGDETLTIVSEAFRSGWNYRLELPDTIERTRFVRAIVSVLLLEWANRNASGRSAEIPVWLSEGLTRQLLAEPDVGLIPQWTPWTADGRAVGPTVFDLPRTDPMEAARRQLRERPPLTLEELSWPDGEQLSSPEGGAYCGSAQLFVMELLRLTDGRACLRAMLAELGRGYNWQIAFFRAFHAHFEQPLDLEKWWALQVVSFTGRDPGQTWTPAGSWARLDEILRTPVQIRHSAGEWPERGEVSLQTILREWDRPRQIQALRARLLDIELARLRMSQGFVGLVDDYRKLLVDCLKKRPRTILNFAATRPTAPMSESVVRDALKRLDILEAKRQALRPEPDTGPVGKAETDSTVAP